MTREPFETEATRRPHMSEAARADVEALRASERLQRIFAARPGAATRAPRPDVEATSTVRTEPRPEGRAELRAERGSDRPGVPRQETAPPADDNGTAPSGRGLFSSRRARVVVGLAPLYLAVAVLAAEGLSRMGDPSEAPPIAAPGRTVEIAAADADSGPAASAPARQLPAQAGGDAVIPPDDAAESGADAGAVRAPVPIPADRPDVLASAPAAPDGEAGQGDIDKAADELAKGRDGGPESGSGAFVGRSAAAGGPEAERAGAIESAETVPQATWSPGASPPPTARAAETGRELARDGGDAPKAQPAQAGRAGVRGGAPPRIVLHYRGEPGASAARRLAEALRARGFGRTELRRVSFAVSQANVRYFHGQNLPVAREVNGLLRAMGRRSKLRDFTHYAPSPSVGTVEVWLPG